MTTPTPLRERLRSEVMRAAMKDNFVLSRDDVIELLGGMSAVLTARDEAGAVACGACGKEWDGQKCGQAENGWPFPVCYPLTNPAPGGVGDAVTEALREYEKLRDHVGGCTDGGCVVKRPQGMHTNGGCRCSRDYMTAQRMMYAGQRLHAAIAARTGKGEADGR